MKRIAVYSPATDARDAARVAEAVAAGSLSAFAPPTREFEGAFAARMAMPHAAAVSSGTAALELAIWALGLGPGDEVLCPALTIISCARAIVLAGARPVLVDVDPKTWCLDPESIRRRLGPRTRAILGVHLFGNPYDHDAIAEIARTAGAMVVEDAAQAHGAIARTKSGPLPCGSLGDVSVFSFYANKAITTGEGGMVLSRDEGVIRRVRDGANLFLGGQRRFLHEDLGSNYRMSSVQAALGLAQLERLDETLATKRRIARAYWERLAEIPGIELQQRASLDDAPPWMIPVVLGDDSALDAEEISARLAERGVETRPFFMGLHDQPALKRRGLFEGESYPVTERLSRRGFYLPSGLDLDEETIDWIAAALRSSLAEGPTRAASAAIPSAPKGSSEGQPFGDAYAEAYDAFYRTKDYDGEVDLLVECFRRFSKGPVKRLLDLGCGSGRHAEALMRRGFEVVGVDRSESMLKLARARLPKARFEQGDMRTVDLKEKFDAVLVLFAALGYQTTAPDILRALRTARRHANEGSLLVADVWLGAGGGSAPTRRTATSDGVEWSRTGFIERDPVSQRVDLAYELVRSEAGAVTVTREVHSMHYFSPFELTFALELAGFELLLLCREGNLDQSPTSSDLTALFVARAVRAPDAPVLSPGP